MTDSPPPALLTPDLLDTLRSHKHLPDDVWYIVVATTLAILNRPEEIQTVYRHAVAPQANNKNNGGVALTLALTDDDEQLRIARRMREALLKTSAIGGLPKVGKLNKDAVGPRTHPPREINPHPPNHPRLTRKQHSPSTPSKNSKRPSRRTSPTTPPASPPRPAAARTSTGSPALTRASARQMRSWPAARPSSTGATARWPSG